MQEYGKIERGQKVLIIGASGGVGHFVVQVAKLLGAEVHAVCGPNHLDFVTSLGADMVYDYTTQPASTITLPFHVVFDVFGRYSRKDFIKQLGSRGIFVSTVPKLTTLRGEFLAGVSFNKSSRLVQVRSKAKDLNQIREWIEAKQLMPHISKTFPVTRAADAHVQIESKHTTGKIVLTF